MRRNRFAGPIGSVALTLTLLAGCADAPTSPVPQFRTTLPPPTGAKGLCPPGFGLIRIEDLPESDQEVAWDVDNRADMGVGPPGNRDGFVCVAGPSDKLVIIDNSLPLDD